MDVGIRKKIRVVWHGMRSRCADKNLPRYGGRGISVCDEWSQFGRFYEWAISNGYRPELQIDRIDNDGNYEPRNCRFVTRKQNTRNSTVIKLTEKSVAFIRRRLLMGQTCCSLASGFGVSIETIQCIKYGKTWGDIFPATERDVGPVPDGCMSQSWITLARSIATLPAEMPPVEDLRHLHAYAGHQKCGNPTVNDERHVVYQAINGGSRGQLQRVAGGWKCPVCGWHELDSKNVIACGTY